jgi:hypothetical protein
MTKFYGPILIKDLDFVKAVLRAHEGCRFRAYNMGDDHPTIGTGFNLDRFDASDILKACGIPHKISDLKTCKATVTEPQIKRLDNYLLNEAALIAASGLGGEKFTNLTAAQQAAAISLATNSPKFMTKIASFMKNNNWDDSYLQKKAVEAEERDRKKHPEKNIHYPGLKIRYTEIQECLKNGDFPQKFYKERKIQSPTTHPDQTSSSKRAPSSIPSTSTLLAQTATPTTNDIVNDNLLGLRISSTHSLLLEQQLNYFTEIRNRAFAMADSINGSLGDDLKKQVLKIGLDTQSGNPISSLMQIFHSGINELKNGSPGIAGKLINY